MSRDKYVVAYLTQGQQVVLPEKRVRATARCTVQEGECRDVRALSVSGPASPAASLSHFKEHSREGVPRRGAQPSGCSVAAAAFIAVRQTGRKKSCLRVSRGEGETVGATADWNFLTLP